jgi:anthranilate/para-aminobenzoate synthase component I
MQILSLRLEGTTRGPYVSCVGCFSFWWGARPCEPARREPRPTKAEFPETVNKSKAMLKAVALAETSAKTEG